MSGKTPGSPRHPSSRRPRPSDLLCLRSTKALLDGAGTTPIPMKWGNSEQRFRKGVGGQRGLAWGDHSYAKGSNLFSAQFFFAPLGGHNSGNFLVLCVWALSGANPLPPTPFRNLWSDQSSDHREFEPPEFKSSVNLQRKGNSDHGPSFLPGKTQTMFRVNCQNGDGGGSWVGHLLLHPNSPLLHSVCALEGSL